MSFFHRGRAEPGQDGGLRLEAFGLPAPRRIWKRCLFSVWFLCLLSGCVFSFCHPPFLLLYVCVCVCLVYIVFERCLFLFGLFVYTCFVALGWCTLVLVMCSCWMLFILFLVSGLYYCALCVCVRCGVIFVSSDLSLFFNCHVALCYRCYLCFPFFVSFLVLVVCIDVLFSFPLVYVLLRCFFNSMMSLTPP